MKTLKLCIYVIVVCFISVSQGISQCQVTFGNLLGSVIENERGYSLTASPDGQYIYVGGIRKDSALIVKVSVSGDIQWTRTFNVVPGREDHIHCLFVDADGMLGVAGTAGTQANGGTIFAFRYDPENNSILWANEYISTSNNYSQGMIEKSPGGNYLMTNNPQEPNVAELVELDKNNGHIVVGFSKHYDLGSAESIYDFAFHNGMMYASGRFTDGGSVAEMRNTLMKINSDNGDIVWMKIGHRPANVTSRFYGFDLVILQDKIFSIYNGDEESASVNNTKIFIQQSDINANLLWVKKYDLPVGNDWGDEMIASDGGLVILARNRIAPSNIILFKVDMEGDILWSNEYNFLYNDNATPIGSIQSQLIEASGYLFLTAYAEEFGGQRGDIILMKTDLEGKIQDTCSAVSPITIAVSSVVDPVFYNIQPNVYDYVPQRKPLSISEGKTTSILSTSICRASNAVTSFTEEIICAGDMFEGYSQTGVYQDTFISMAGCDSIRTLSLMVVPIVYSTIEAQICPGEMYEGYFEMGMYIDTFGTDEGCDSIRTLILGVGMPVVEEIMNVCAGSIYHGYETDVMLTDTLFGLGGDCDTIRNLTVHFLPPVQSIMEVTICEGETYENYSISGWYTDTLTTLAGCDSLRTLHLQLSAPILDEELVLCAGASYNGYEMDGMFTDTLQGVAGDCDTIRNLTVQFLPPIQSNIDVTICQGETYEEYSIPGWYTDMLKTPEGCDSIRTLHLSIEERAIVTVESTVCDVAAGAYVQPGMYTDTLTSINGCDSIRTLVLYGTSIYIPNVFSPNEDGINDFFSVISYPIEGISVSYFAVFDRFGNMAYEVKEGAVNWNGKDKNGKYYNPGVFAYVCKYMCNQEEVIETGTVTLIR